MTTIVWRKPYMACDGRVTEEDQIFTDTCQKVYTLKDGSLLGVAGTASDQELVSLLNKPKLPNHKQLVSLNLDFICILAKPDGQVFYIASEKEDNKDRIAEILDISKEPFFAIGSGAPYALGALEMKATAKQATSVAIKKDSKSGGKPQVYELKYIG